MNETWATRASLANNEAKCHVEWGQLGQGPTHKLYTRRHGLVLAYREVGVDACQRSYQVPLQYNHGYTGHTAYLFIIIIYSPLTPTCAVHQQMAPTSRVTFRSNLASERH